MAKIGRFLEILIVILKTAKSQANHTTSKRCNCNFRWPKSDLGYGVWITKIESSAQSKVTSVTKRPEKSELLPRSCGFKLEFCDNSIFQYGRQEE